MTETQSKLKTSAYLKQNKTKTKAPSSRTWNVMWHEYSSSSLISISLHLFVLHFSLLTLFIERSTSALAKWPPEVLNFVSTNLGPHWNESAVPRPPTKVSGPLFIGFDKISLCQMITLESSPWPERTNMLIYLVQVCSWYQEKTKLLPNDQEWNKDPVFLQLNRCNG